MSRTWSLLPALLLLLLAAATAAAQTPDQGIPELRQLDPTLTGSGVSVIQAEAIFTGNNDWEVDPPGIGQPVSKFTFISASGTSNSYPNSLGIVSSHANYVAEDFYGDTNPSNPEGIAYGISQVYNYEAENFVENIIVPDNSPLPAEIVNQSFELVVSSTSEEAMDNRYFDNYADNYGTLFVDGAGISGQVSPPASAYNDIAVAAYGGTVFEGNYDGRSKPDIVAYAVLGGAETSYAAPVVSGAAAILLEAAQRGDAGSSPQVEAAASDARVLKALLLNGATKPAGWKSTVADPTTTPLDPALGAGILNIYNSYLNLAAGEHSFSASLSGPVAPVSSGPLDPAEGWDFETVANTFSLQQNGYLDQSNHYLFSLSASTAPAFTLTATLDWWIENNQSSINNFYLYLFDAGTDQTVAASLSTIDNVQVIYAQDLPPGNYDLAIVKSGAGMVSASDTYALAYNFAAVPEPSTLWLLPCALGLLLVRRKIAPPAGCARSHKEYL